MVSPELWRNSVFHPSLTLCERMVYNHGMAEGQMTRCSVPGDTIPFAFARQRYLPGPNGMGESHGAPSPKKPSRGFARSSKMVRC